MDSTCYFCWCVCQQQGTFRSWLLFSIAIFSPLIGFLFALAVKPNVAKVEENAIQQGENKKCPYCAELIKIEAIVCRYCGRDLKNNDEKNSESKNISPEDDLKKYEERLKSYSTVEIKNILRCVDKKSYPEKYSMILKEFDSRKIET